LLPGVNRSPRLVGAVLSVSGRGDGTRVPFVYEAPSPVLPERLPCRAGVWWRIAVGVLGSLLILQGVKSYFLSLPLPFSCLCFFSPWGWGPSVWVVVQQREAGEGSFVVHAHHFPKEAWKRLIIVSSLALGAFFEGRVGLEGPPSGQHLGGRLQRTGEVAGAKVYPERR